MTGGFILQAAIVVIAYLTGRYRVFWKLAMYTRAKLCAHIRQVPFGTSGNNVCLSCQQIIKPDNKDFQDFNLHLSGGKK
jgi:hypothetical protein